MCVKIGISKAAPNWTEFLRKQTAPDVTVAFTASFTNHWDTISFPLRPEPGSKNSKQPVDSSIGATAY